MIAGYEVVYSSHEEDATSVFKEVVPVQIANPQLTLGRLTPRTQHTFKVCIVAVCAHKRLRGPFSELSNITTEEAGMKCKLHTHNVIV